ncbi:MAG: hypothetical protein AAF266_01755 [Planctomycetota bacterium]
MKRVLFLAVALGTAVPSSAFWLDEFYCYLETRRQENNRWPEQFVEADRANTMAPFNVMVQNGWRRQNLLGSHHFNEDGTKLSQSGKLRIQWILTQAPPQHRQLFVEQSLNEEHLANRIATANEFASEVSRDGYPAEAQQTHILSDGRPAVTVDFVNTQFRENMMIPALPENSAPQVTE